MRLYWLLPILLAACGNPSTLSSGSSSGKYSIIQVVNEAGGSDAYLKVYLPALNAQIRRDVFPLWTSQINQTWSAAPIVVLTDESALDTSQPYALIGSSPDSQSGDSFHDTDDSGTPRAEVSISECGNTPTLCLGHEVLEMIIDPFVDACLTSPRDGGQYLREIVDPVESLYYLDQSTGLPLVDFVIPEFYGPKAANQNNTRLDFNNDINLSVTQPWLAAHDGKQTLGVLEPGC